MKSRTFKRSLLMLTVVVVMLCAFTSTAFALDANGALAPSTIALAEMESNVNEKVVASPNDLGVCYHFTTTITDSWQNILGEPSGINCNVELSVNAFQLGDNKVAVRMWNGSEYIYTDYDALTKYQTSRVFWCGPDIQYVDVMLITFPTVFPGTTFKTVDLTVTAPVT